VKIKLGDPAAVPGGRDRDEPDDRAVDDGDRGPPRRDQPPRDPGANVVVGMRQRRERHQFLAGAQEHVGHLVGVSERGRAKLERHRERLARHSFSMVAKGLP